MIPESIIEEVIGHYDSDKKGYESSMTEIMEQQPALIAFLSQESNDVLTEDEKDILWYLILIIIISTKRQGIAVSELSDVDLGNIEETNWQVLQTQPKGTFRDKVTVFFDDYEQEDLLAFVEDSLELDDESPITSVGRDVIFISAKTVIDTIFKNQN